MQALPVIAGILEDQHPPHRFLGGDERAQLHQERPHLVVVPVRGLVFRRRLAAARAGAAIPRAAPSRGRRYARRNRAARCCLWSARTWGFLLGGAQHRRRTRRHARPAGARRRHRTASSRPDSRAPCIRGAIAARARSPARRARSAPRPARRRSRSLRARARGASTSTPCACSEFTVTRRSPSRLLQQAAFGDVDVVGRRIVHVHVGRLGRAVIAPSLDLVHMLVQRAAQRDIDLLQAAADREQRHAAVDRVPDQRQGRRSRAPRSCSVPSRLSLP